MQDVSTERAAGLRERCPDGAVRDAVAAVRADALGEDRRDHAALRIDDRPARVAAANDAANRHHLAADREVAVRVAADDLHDAADADGRLGVRAVARVAEQARRVFPGRRRRASAAARAARRPGARRRRCVLSNETICASSSAPSLRSTWGVSTPATTWALVTTSPLPAIQPEPSIPSPQALPTTRTTLSAALLTPGESSTAGSGGPTPAAGPARVANGSICDERVDQPVRRQLLVEAGEDRRVLRVVAQLGLAREVEEHRADGPAEREPGDGAEHAAADVVEEPKRAEHDEQPPQVPPGQRADGLADRGAHHRTAERDERQPAREVTADQRRPDAGAEVEADREPGEREDADHEPTPEARERGQDDERDGDQVEGRHSSRFARERRSPAPPARVVRPDPDAAATILRPTGA